MYEKLRNESYEQYLRPYRKNGKKIKYLPWFASWDILKKYFPNSSYEWVKSDFDGRETAGIYNPDGSFIIHCRITIHHKGVKYIHNEYMHTDDIKNEGASYVLLEYAFRKTLSKGISMMTGFGSEYWKK